MLSHCHFDRSGEIYSKTDFRQCQEFFARFVGWKGNIEDSAVDKTKIADIIRA
jgi:hypothetical protein